MNREANRAELTRTSSAVVFTINLLITAIVLTFGQEHDFLITVSHIAYLIFCGTLVWSFRVLNKMSYKVYQSVVMALIFSIAIMSGIEAASSGVFLVMVNLPLVIAVTTLNAVMLYICFGMQIVTVAVGTFIAIQVGMPVPRPIEFIAIFLMYAGMYAALINLVGAVNRRIRVSLDQEQSYDDMLKVIFMKCEDARAATKSKSSFLANMSHEIRTPINAVVGMGEMILRESREEGIRKYALDIKNAAKSLLSIINDILDSSKIESGKMEIVPVEYELASTLNDVVNMTNARVGDKNLNVEYIISPELPSILYGDDIRIKQIFMNILSNAIKYTPAGSVTLIVDGEVDGEELVLRAEVTDTGIGIKKEDIPKLFEAFERIDMEKNRNVEGTGLGMSITMGLLKMMGGTLTCDSEYGKGTTFVVKVRQRIVSPVPIGDFKERMKEEALEYNYVTTKIAPTAKVLVVDDNDINRSVFRALLKQTQVKIDDVASGKACLDIITRNFYDIIFLDHMMPEMDGIETLRKMKELPANLCDTSPVIMLTANAMAGAKEKYLAEGFDSFLSKPIIPEKLEAMLFEYLPEDKIEEVKSEKKELPPESNDKDSQAGKTSEVETEENNNEVELPSIDEINWDHAKVHIADGDILKVTAVSFYRSIDKELAELNDLYAKLDNKESLDLYRIKVHALKSSGLVIGALVLFGIARMLEVAAKDGDFDRIHALHPVLCDELLRYKERLAVLDDTPQEKPLAEKDDVIDNLDVLIECLKDDDKDADAIGFLCEQIDEFSYDPELQLDVNNLMDAVKNEQYDIALVSAKLIKESFD